MQIVGMFAVETEVNYVLTKNTRAGANKLIQFVSLVGKKVNFKVLQKYDLFGLQSVDDYVYNIYIYIYKRNVQHPLFCRLVKW